MFDTIFNAIHSKTNLHSPLYSAQRHVSLTAARAIDQRWREAKGLPENPNAFGPLTNLPDYTYLDGRTTPLGVSFLTFYAYIYISNHAFVWYCSLIRRNA